MSESENRKPFGFGDGTYQAAGGHEGLIKLVDHFYDAMERLPRAEKIRQMHNSDLTVSREKLVYFLSGWMGGPQIYSDKFGAINIPMDHAHLLIDENDRDAWLICMAVALEELEYPEDFSTYVLEQLYRPAERIRQVSQARHST